MKHLWLAATVTGASPSEGEIIGLDVFDLDMRRWLVSHALFHPVRPRSPEATPPAGPVLPRHDIRTYHDGSVRDDVSLVPMTWRELDQRLPFSVYATRIREILSGCETVRGRTWNGISCSSLPRGHMTRDGNPPWRDDG